MSSQYTLIHIESKLNTYTFMPTGVFNPLKLTGRSVIIGSLVLLYHFTEIVVSFKQTA